jgi:hypothetical protein
MIRALILLVAFAMPAAANHPGACPVPGPQSFFQTRAALHACQRATRKLCRICRPAKRCNENGCRSGYPTDVAICRSPYIDLLCDPAHVCQVYVPTQADCDELFPPTP